jgi:hypothetical protein
LATLPGGTNTLVFNFKKGDVDFTANLVVEIDPLKASLSPIYPGVVSLTLVPNDYSFVSVKLGETVLDADLIDTDDYAILDNVITFSDLYLSGLAAGSSEFTLVFEYNGSLLNLPFEVVVEEVVPATTE